MSGVAPDEDQGIRPVGTMNNMNNAIKPIPLNHIFVHRLVNTAEQREQSNWSRPVSFTLFSVVPEPVNE